MDVAELTGVPAWLPDHLHERGVESLYPPQAEAVERGVTDGRNLVASVPTASGKTLVAELAMLASVARGGKALYIVPLRALASEKREEFERYEQYGVSVGVSTGNYESGEEWLADRDVIVATSEKVDSLVRNDAAWINSLTCVVADEVHLVDDDERGPTLEVTLAKLRRINPTLQVVALSATIGNADELAGWLDAELVDSEWRPIDLRKGVHFGEALHFDDGSKRELPVRGSEKPTGAIVRDTASDDGSTLVFVNSRRNAEAAARRLANVTDDFVTEEERRRLAAVAEEIREVSDTETSEDLADAVERGAAFHHAGCEGAHRSLVEEAFRDRIVKAIAATPTLAAGVNTPSRRVVVRDWRRYDSTAGGMAPLSVLEVHQMMGRAGRPGLDPYGEALLLAKTHDELDDLFERYVWAEPEPVRSKLAAEPAMRTHILSTVASGFARSRDGLLEFLGETLYASQTDEHGRLERVLDDMLAYLEANDFLESPGGGETAGAETAGAETAGAETVGAETAGAETAGAETAWGEIRATDLGHTVSRLYLDPMSAAEIIDGLRDAEGAEPTALGLYHLVSRTPDMYELYLRSGEHEDFTQLAYEREPEFLGTMPSEFDDAFEDWLSALKTARLLEDWASEIEEDRITDRYGVGPGDIRGKVDTAGWLLGAAERLAGELGLGVAPAVREATIRVKHGVKSELVDLAGVRDVGRKRARRLYEAGIEDRTDLREAEKSVVLGAVRGRRKTAETILENVGREDPSMDGVDAVGGPASGAADGGEGSVAHNGGQSETGDGENRGGLDEGGNQDEGDKQDEDQSDLGDF